MFGLALGMGFSVVLIGIPSLIVVVLVSRRVATFEQILANELLGLDLRHRTIQSPIEGEQFRQTLERYLGAGSTWKEHVLLYLKVWFGLFSFATLVVGVTVPTRSWAYFSRNH